MKLSGHKNMHEENINVCVQRYTTTKNQKKILLKNIRGRKKSPRNKKSETRKMKHIRLIRKLS